MFFVSFSQMRKWKQREGRVKRWVCYESFTSYHVTRSLKFCIDTREVTLELWHHFLDEALRESIPAVPLSHCVPTLPCMRERRTLGFPFYTKDTSHIYGNSILGLFHYLQLFIHLISYPPPFLGAGRFFGPNPVMLRDDSCLCALRDHSCQCSGAHTWFWGPNLGQLSARQAPTHQNYWSDPVKKCL